MRRLVACNDCHRKYDASRRAVGSRFRCHCGEILEVRQAKGHDASVIRCSSCGGPREEGKQACGFCNADFTIHERDLNTVCPECLARVSDRSRFCQHCGTRLFAEEVVKESAELKCPACTDQRQLASRRLGHEKMSVLECSHCAGLWLERSNFEILQTRAAKGHAEIDTLIRGTPRPANLVKQTGPLYRKCIHCDKMMHRRQYAQGSGVIVDICRDHGVWFDAAELQQVLAWISKGGAVRDIANPTARPKVSDKAIVSELQALANGSSTTQSIAADQLLDEVIDGLSRLAGWLFSK